MSDIEEDEVVDNEEELIDNQEELVDNLEDDPETIEQAKKYGHLSKEEWEAQGRDPKRYKTPEEFNKTAQNIDLHLLKKKVDQRDREIQALVEYQQRTSQREYERAKQDLESRLAAAENDLDVKAVSHYTKEITRLQDAEQSSQQHIQQSARQSAQEAFLERNEHWFNDRNPDLKARAVEIDNELKEIYPNASFDDLAQKIEKRMQYDYPERVLGGSKVPRTLVQSSINKSGMVKKDVFRSLSQEHKDTYHVYKRINPKITEEAFIQRLKADGEL